MVIVSLINLPGEDIIPKMYLVPFPRRRHPLLPLPLLLVVAAFFCSETAAQSLGCTSSNPYIKYSPFSKSFFEALSSNEATDFYPVSDDSLQ